MLILALIGLLGGLITGVSPCILPVLPVVFLAGGASKRPDGAPESESDTGKPKRSRRPYAIIAGLVLSFSFFTLLGSILITALGLPVNILHYAGLILLVLIGLGMIFARFGQLIDRPFARLSIRTRNHGRDGGFVLGLGLGLVYVPCAGPVLTAIAVAGATHKLSLNIVVLTLSFAVGATLPLLVFALAGRQGQRPGEGIPYPCTTGTPRQWRGDDRPCRRPRLQPHRRSAARAARLHRHAPAERREQLGATRSACPI